MEAGEGEGGDRGRLRPLPDPPSYRAAGLARPVIAMGRRGGRTLRQVTTGTSGGTAAWGEWGEGGESNYMRGTMGLHVPIL